VHNEANTALFVRPVSELAKEPGNAKLGRARHHTDPGNHAAYMCANYLKASMQHDDVTF
jgi:hypothetical protein